MTNRPPAAVPSPPAPGYALAMTGMGPYCLVKISEGLQAGEWAMSMCGRRAVVCTRGGGLFQWSPREDTVCADCLAAVRDAAAGRRLRNLDGHDGAGWVVRRLDPSHSRLGSRKHRRALREGWSLGPRRLPLLLTEGG